MLITTLHTFSSFSLILCYGSAWKTKIKTKYYQVCKLWPNYPIYLLLVYIYHIKNMQKFYFIINNLKPLLQQYVTAGWISGKTPNTWPNLDRFQRIGLLKTKSSIMVGIQCIQNHLPQIPIAFSAVTLLAGHRESTQPARN